MVLTMDKENLYNVLDSLKDEFNLDDLLDEMAKALSSEDLEYVLKGICQDWDLDNYNDEQESVELENWDKQDYIADKIINESIVVTDKDIKELIDDIDGDSTDYMVDATASGLAMNLDGLENKQAIDDFFDDYLVTVYQTPDSFYIFTEN